MVQMQKREKVVAVRQNKEATDEEKTNLRTHGAVLNREGRVKLHLKGSFAGVLHTSTGEMQRARQEQSQERLEELRTEQAVRAGCCQGNMSQVFL